MYEAHGSTEIAFTVAWALCTISSFSPLLPYAYVCDFINKCVLLVTVFHPEKFMCILVVLSQTRFGFNSQVPKMDQQAKASNIGLENFTPRVSGQRNNKA